MKHEAALPVGPVGAQRPKPRDLDFAAGREGAGAPPDPALHLKACSALMNCRASQPAMGPSEAVPAAAAWGAVGRVAEWNVPPPLGSACGTRAQRPAFRSRG